LPGGSPGPKARAALALVAGETPLGIVPRDRRGGRAGIRVVGLFLPQSHGPIVYPIAGIA
jgi:molybdate transport system substrate-binding protein